MAHAKIFLPLASLACIFSMLTSCTGFGGVNLESLGVLPQCLPSRCHSPVYHAYGPNNMGYLGGPSSGVQLECDVASGHIPIQGLQLPIYEEGNFDLCKTFGEAHYCTIYAPLAVPLTLPNASDQSLNDAALEWMSHFWDTGDGIFPIGPLVLGQCVSKSCSGEDLKASFFNVAENLVFEYLEEQNFTFANIHAEQIRMLFDSAMGEPVRGQIKAAIKVSCATPNEPLAGAALAIVLVFAVFCALTLFATVVDVYFGGRLSCCARMSSRVASTFSATLNTSKLLSSFQSDFNVLNGVRFFSMMWIIAGHTHLYQDLIFLPPNLTALQDFAYSLGFSWFMSAFRAVDTFFFISGFLGAWTLIKVLRKSPFTPALYLKMVLVRYLRLTPLYLFLMLVYWKLPPLFVNNTAFAHVMNDGIYTVDASCNLYWWTNLLYVNNLLPWYEPSQCMGWSWYLSNDFQFFLMCPFVVKIYLNGSQNPSKFVKLMSLVFPCLVLVSVQLVITYWTFTAYDLTESVLHGEYWGRFYAAPWCRWSPYFIGACLAMFHDSRNLKSNKGKENVHWKRWAIPSWSVHLIVVLSLAVMILYCSLQYYMYNCREPGVDCRAWLSAVEYPLLPWNGGKQWDPSTVKWYYVFVTLAWTLPLALIMYAMMCGYDTVGAGCMMSAHFFFPMARLTYGAYLVHLILIRTWGWTSPRVPAYSVWYALSQIIAYVVVSYGISYITFVTIEKPLQEACNVLLGMDKKAAQRVDAKGSESESVKSQNSRTRGVV